MKTFKFEVTLKIADRWVEDGFGATSKKDQTRLCQQVQVALEQQLLTGANLTSEFGVSVKIIEHPDLKAVAKLQGYKQ